MKASELKQSEVDSVVAGVLEPMKRLSKDMVLAAKTLSDSEARFLVDAYYIMQEDRKRSNNQVLSLETSAEPNSVISWLALQSHTLESQIKRALDAYSDAHRVGAWLRSIDGIGPVIAAGLLAHIDIHKAPTVGHIWRYAGLDSTAKWVSTEEAEKWLKDKGDASPELVALAAKHFGRSYESLLRFASTDREGAPIALSRKSIAKAIARRPHNASLKTLCWKVGESFVKVKNKPTDYYGKVYAQRRALEGEKNAKGDYAQQAAAVLAARPTHAQAETYKKGLLPDGHLHMRAKRYAVKLFLSHLHEVWRKAEGLEVPLPYPIAFLGHAHKIEPQE